MRGRSTAAAAAGRYRNWRRGKFIEGLRIAPPGARCTLALFSVSPLMNLRHRAALRQCRFADGGLCEIDVMRRQGCRTRTDRWRVLCTDLSVSRIALVSSASAHSPKWLM